MSFNAINDTDLAERFPKKMDKMTRELIWWMFFLNLAQVIIITVGVYFCSKPFLK